MSDAPRKTAIAEPATGVPADPWTTLRTLTPARIALGRSGASLPTRELLAFGVAHAQARDAVHTALDVVALRAALADALGLPIVVVGSAATTRAAYLARPDWGRRLSAESQAALSGFADIRPKPDVQVVLADGLSAQAVQRHALPLLRAALPRLAAAGVSLAPLVVATQARVALADPIAAASGARLAICLIGERPGLSAPDSLGAYLTYAPKPGLSHDAERECLSNIRPAGLPPDVAAETLVQLALRCLAARHSGVAPPAALPG